MLYFSSAKTFNCRNRWRRMRPGLLSPLNPEGPQKPQVEGSCPLCLLSTVAVVHPLGSRSISTFIRCTCSLRGLSVCQPPDCCSSVTVASYWLQSASSRVPPSHHARRSVRGCGLSPSTHTGRRGRIQMSFNILLISYNILQPYNITESQMRI